MGVKNYFVYVNPSAGVALRSALKNQQTELARRVLSELDGIGEIGRGSSRQMILSKPEIRLVSKLVSDHKIGLTLDTI